MNRIMATIAAALLMLSASALAAGTEHALGEHPAVIVKRMYDKQGYDYASKFYPHPGPFLPLQRGAEGDHGSGNQRRSPATGSADAGIDERVAGDSSHREEALTLVPECKHLAMSANGRGA